MPDTERWRAIVETAIDAIITIDQHGAIETFNPAAEELFGFSAAEVIGQNVTMLMPSGIAREHDSYMRRFLSGGRPRIIGLGREVIGRHRSGEPIALHLSVGEIRVEGVRSFVGILRDTRPENAMRDALQAREAEYAAVVDAMTEGFVVQRGDGTVLTVNRAAHRMLGLTPDRLPGETGRGPLVRMLREDGSEWPDDEHPAAVTLRTGASVKDAIMGIDRGAEGRAWIQMTTLPLALLGHDRPGVVSLFEDVTERRAAEAALLESERAYRLLAENSSDLILRVSPSGEILYASSAARRFGYEPSDLVGRSTEELLDSGDTREREHIAQRVDSSSGTTVVEGLLLRGDGAREWCEATVRAIRDGSGDVVERQASIRSIARRMEQEAEIVASLARYQALARHLPGGAVFLFDRDQRYLLAEGPAAAELTNGADPVGLTPRQVFDPDMADYVGGLYLKALGGEEQTFRADAPSGRVYDVTITPILANDAITGGMALALDVTERARLEAEQAALQDIAHSVAASGVPEEILTTVVTRVAALFGAVGAAIFRFDPDGRATVVASSPQSPDQLLPEARLALDPGTAIGQVLLRGQPVVVADYGASDDVLVRALRSLGAVGGAAAPIVIHQRTWGALGIGGAQPERLTEETAERLARFAELVAANVGNVEAWEAITREATTDRLTGLPNRGAFDSRLAEEIARSRRHDRPLSLLVFDVDHFKTINDSFGHPVGDRVLSMLAQLVSREIRGEEMLARIGGEEFAVLLPETDIVHAAAAAERLRGTVAAARFDVAGVVTVSVGVDGLRDLDDPEDLIRRADHALYAAKAAGRNAVSRWQEGLRGPG